MPNWSEQKQTKLKRIRRERMIVCCKWNWKTKMAFMHGSMIQINWKEENQKKKYSQHTTYTNTNDRQQCRCFNQVMQTENTLHKYKRKRERKSKRQTLFTIERIIYSKQNDLRWSIFPPPFISSLNSLVILALRWHIIAKKNKNYQFL